jgi:hypothetical protein
MASASSSQSVGPVPGPVGGSNNFSSFSRSVLSMIHIKLDRSNFFQWLSLVKPALEANYLWQYTQYVDKSQQEKNGRITLKNSLHNEIKEDSNNSAEKKAALEFQSNAAIVILFLRASLSEDVAAIAMGYDRPWELFYIIEKYCKPQQTAEWQMIVNGQLAKIKMNDNETTRIGLLIARLTNVFRNYAAAFGHELDDTAKSVYLFKAIPDSGPWGDWKRVQRQFSKCSFNDHCSAASVKELEILTSSSNISYGVGSSSSSSSASSSVYSAAENKNKGEKKCWHCGKVGHEKKDCRKLMHEIKQKGQSNGGSGSKLFCNYCKKTNHTEDKCFKKQNNKLKREQAALADGTSAFDQWCMMKGIDDSHSSDGKFYLDSGATRHLCGNRSFLHNIHQLSSPVSIQLADGRTVSVTEEGEIHLDTPSGRRFIKNVALYQGGASNLISVGALVDKFKGASTTFTDSNGIISDKNGKVLFESVRAGRSLYAVKGSIIYPASVSAFSSPVERIQMLSDDDLSLWH